MTAPDLARRLVEHPRWTWQPGMGALDVAGPGIARTIVVDPDDVPPGRTHYPAWIPDLDHPATKGWLLHTCDRRAARGHLAKTHHLETGAA